MTRKSLNEADDSKYGLTADIVSPKNVEEEPEEETSAAEENAPIEDAEQLNNPDETDAAPVDDPTSPDDESEGMATEEEMAEEGDMSEEDINAEAEQTPGLKILTSIPDKQYNLNNYELFKKFEKLYNDVENYINNTIMDLKPITERQTQFINKVHENMLSMTNDVKNYMMTYSDTYETNTVAYATFLKRFKLCVDIISDIKKELDAKSYEDDK